MSEINENLKPCPFCGEKRIFLNEPVAGYPRGSINCPACLVVMPGEVNEKELIDCWNARSPVNLVDIAEECAKIAESHVGAANDPNYDEACRDIAKAIRDIYGHE